MTSYVTSYLTSYVTSFETSYLTSYETSYVTSYVTSCFKQRARVLVVDGATERSWRAVWTNLRAVPLSPLSSSSVRLKQNRREKNRFSLTLDGLSGERRELLVV